MENQVKIMVVDDEIGICQNVEKILTKNNYSVVHTQSAGQALEMMKDGSFSLLISDIVMPEMNGLELLSQVAKEVPDIKTVMMTGYASTNTAVKAIRLGALDYIPKPFTPDELRTTVSKALLGKYEEIRISEEERQTIEIMDIDIDFGGDAAENLVKPSPVEKIVEEKLEQVQEFHCAVGDMVCDVMEKLGTTCKTGLNKKYCPKLKARAKKMGKKANAFNPKTMIGIDQPFDYDEVLAVTGPEYIRDLDRDGFAFLPYEELKKVDPKTGPQKGSQNIGIDQPFDYDEVAQVTGTEYVQHVDRDGHAGLDYEALKKVDPNPAEQFHCAVGDMVCDVMEKLGTTCKTGLNKKYCPKLKARAKKLGKKANAFNPKTMIGIDQPFDYDEVLAVTGPEYIRDLDRDGFAFLPYEELKKVDPLGGKLKTEAKKILVVDDEVSVNNNIRKILGKTGYEIDQAVSKAEAIEKINHQPYRLVLLDLRMPGVAGLELLEAISEAQPSARVIIITGYASIGTAIETARIGAVDYLPKPFTPDELRHVTQRAYTLAA
ncbi:MAG: response regulator [Desulfobacter sp.]|nr:MAG: response regulator [Desulfobacter sp.]